MDIDSVLKGHGIGIGGSNIKSIQRGTVIGNTPNTITISSVDLTKAIVLISFCPGQNLAAYESYTVKFNSSTQIVINSYSNWSSSTEIAWTVIEFNNVKSIQKGSYSWSTTTGTKTTKNITISSIDLNKSVVIVTVRDSTSDTNVEHYFCEAVLTSNTNLKLLRYDTPSVVEWQVIEFN